MRFRDDSKMRASCNCSLQDSVVRLYDDESVTRFWIYFEHAHTVVVNLYIFTAVYRRVRTRYGYNNTNVFLAVYDFLFTMSSSARKISCMCSASTLLNNQTATD